jgi:hypothetical protein
MMSKDSITTSVIMKCFERLVKDHITSTLPDTPLQPQEAEEIQLVAKSIHKLLQMHNREHPAGLYHRLVWQLLRPQP